MLDKKAGVWEVGSAEGEGEGRGEGEEGGDRLTSSSCIPDADVDCTNADFEVLALFEVVGDSGGDRSELFDAVEAADGFLFGADSLKLRGEVGPSCFEERGPTGRKRWGALVFGVLSKPATSSPWLEEAGTVTEMKVLMSRDVRTRSNPFCD